MPFVFSVALWLAYVITTHSVIVTAPVRIADLGGWTDTWFSGHGAVCHLAVRPGVEVRLSARRMRDGPGVVVDARDFGERFDLPDGGTFASRHRLLAAAIDSASRARDQAYHLQVTSGVPPGASMGTSAAVVVAVLAAFDAIAGTALSRVHLARRAHGVEVQSLGQESGIQDQIAAAYGGANFIEMPSYPEAVVEPLSLTPETCQALDARLLLVYLGQAHDSSAVHREVIAALATSGAARRQVLEGLRTLAREGRAALLAGDLAAYGAALSANCGMQAALHPALISDVAAQVIAEARAHGAAGWKVNGAGGDGGSVTVLCGAGAGARDHLAPAIEKQVRAVRVLDLQLSPTGVDVGIPT